jgi:hypothetical protein
MKPYKTFRQYLEERELQEINTTQSANQPGQSPQVLNKWSTAVKGLQGYSPLDAISGKSPKAQQQLMALGAQNGLTPAQQLATMAPDMAKTNEPTPQMVQAKTMKKTMRKQ